MLINLGLDKRDLYISTSTSSIDMSLSYNFPVASYTSKYFKVSNDRVSIAGENSAGNGNHPRGNARHSTHLKKNIPNFGLFSTL